VFKPPNQPTSFLLACTSSDSLLYSRTVWQFLFRSCPSILIYFSLVSTNIYGITHMIGFISQHSRKWLAQEDINCRSKP